MADILEISLPIIQDGETINENHFKVLAEKINEVVRRVNGQEPVPTEVEFFNDDSYGSGYLGTLAECYIPYSFGRICFKSMGNYLFVRPFVTSSSRKWTCKIDNRGFTNGTLITLQVTEVGTDTNAPIGTIVGYCIFKDIDKFRANSQSWNSIDMNNNCQDLANSPTIKAQIENGTLDAPYVGE